MSKADDAGTSITGGITLGCWVYFSPSADGVEMGIIGKWYETGGQRSYALYKDSSNKFVFSVSSNGLTTFSVTDLGANFETEQWYYVVGRYLPSEELALFVNGMWYQNVTTIPASVFDSSESLDFGRYNRDHYLDGRMTHAFLSAEPIPDNMICSMYAHTRSMFMDYSKYNRHCSSSSSSTSSSSSSTTTSSSSSAAP